MRWARLIACFLLVGLIASLVGGFCTALVMSVIASIAEGEPLAFMPGGLFVGVFGAILGLRAFVPITVLGGLLWSFRVRSKLAWTMTGMAGALGFYALLAGLSDLTRDVIGFVGSGWELALAFALSGVPTAFAFRLVMESITAFDDDAPMLD